MNYLAGFCPNGWNCKHMHPRFELPPSADLSKETFPKKIPTCHFCGEFGHKASACKKNPEGNSEQIPTKPASNARYQNYSGPNNSGQPSNQHKDTQENVITDGGNDESSDNLNTNTSTNNGPPYPKVSKPLDEITCYKCGNKGHYANKCPKGHLAFLSNHRSHK